MRFLPIPVPGGSIEALRLLNVQANGDFVLVVAWVLAVLRNRGPYRALVVCGEQGSAKSNITAIMRSLLDPNTAPLRTMPRDARDLFIAASNSHVLAFDNVSCVPNWISDTLCRLSSGGGFATRQLYTNQDEVLFDAARPVILNGIEDMVRRPDLADRGLFLTLEAIPENRRRPQAELWAAFEAERPRILGGSARRRGRRPEAAARNSSSRNLPRMADFALNLGDGLARWRYGPPVPSRRPITLKNEDYPPPGGGMPGKKSLAWTFRLTVGNRPQRAIVARRSRAGCLPHAYPARGELGALCLSA